MSKDTFYAAFDEASSLKFNNTLSGINEFLVKLSMRAAEREKTVVGVEATGVYHLFFCMTLRNSGWKVVVINPLITHRLISGSLRKLKTDRTDAIMVRRAVLSGEGYPYTEAPDVLALKTLLMEREALVRMRAVTKQRLHAHDIRAEAASLKLYDSFSATMKTLSREIKSIEANIQKYTPETQKLLRSIPGIGKLTAAALVGFIGDINRFSSPEKLAAYIGVDVRVHQSGVSINGKGYITKRGNRYLRHVLFNCAFIARQKNPELKSYFLKKISEGKHYCSALCAVERKLIHLIYAVWKRGTPFEPRA
jgi:transposase